MGWTKRKIVEKAFSAFGLDSAFGLPPDQLQGGLDSLNAMMGQWDSEGIRLGFNLDGDLESDSGIDVSRVRAVYTNLGVELAASLGREVSPRISGIASQTYDRLKALANRQRVVRLPSIVPLGAGCKGWRGSVGDAGRVFADDTVDTTDTDTDGELEFD
jgi:hypothetical protein